MENKCICFHPMENTKSQKWQNYMITKKWKITQGMHHQCQPLTQSKYFLTVPIFVYTNCVVKRVYSYVLSSGNSTDQLKTMLIYCCIVSKSLWLKQNILISLKQEGILPSSAGQT
jgi:hypothetical protein